MTRPTLILVVALATGLLAGCGSSDEGDGLTDKDKMASSRIDQIAKASGGDWSKVSEADKKYLINEVSMGSEQSAKMLVMSKSGALRASPGGPPKSGAPGK